MTSFSSVRNTAQRIQWVILCTAIATLFAGCVASAPPLTYAPCIKDNQKNLRIAWGTTNDSLKTGTQYVLDTRGALTQTSTVGQDSSIDELEPVQHTRYCPIADQVTRSFVKVQALHSPGTKARFIEYSNPDAGVFLRAVWNPDLTTFQSRDMRALYDSLMTLVVEP